MKRDYWVDWLTPKHAARVARLERKVYPADYCAGYHSIRGDLRTAEADGRNLSMGVFLDRKLVGFLLAFYEPERARICEYIDVTPPEGIDLSGPGIYLNDFVVDPGHRGAGAVLGMKLTHAVRMRDDLRSIPVDTFSTNTMTDVWSMKVRFLRRMSIEVSERAALRVKAGGEELFWIVFRHVPAATAVESRSASLASRLKRRKAFTVEDREFEIGVCNSVADWNLLEPFWNDLLKRTPGGTVFQSFDYLSTWWAQLGVRNELLIVVVLSAGQPIAIAPMQVSRSTSLGLQRRCLGFLGHPSEVDRNTILLDPAAEPVVASIAGYLVDCGDLWDFVALYEQPPGSPLLEALSGLLRASRCIVTRVPGPECATVAIAGTWNQFLAGKSRSFRKNINRRLAKIAATDDTAVDSLPSPDPDEAALALERYGHIEAASWKRTSALGISKTASHRGFYRQIVRTFAASGQAAFHFMRIGGEDACGTFGLSWQQTFYSLHIAHDEAFADHSPGVALTALELKAAFDRPTIATYDFLGGFMTNKRSWATSVAATVALFAHRRGVNGWLFHWIHFRLRPPARRMLIRLRLLEAAIALKQYVQKLRAR